MDDLPGKPGSIWLDRATPTRFLPLDHPLEVEVAVLGAGITGVTLALTLAEAGLEVALLEAGRVASGASGHSSAKISSLHGLTYAELERRQGEDIARAYGDANEAGLAMIARRVKELEIDCDFSRRDNYTYALDRDQAERVEREVEVAGRLGLPASLATGLDLPFATAAAVKFSEQAQFDPVSYLLALADRFTELGGAIYERSPAVAVDEGRPCIVEVKGGVRVQAQRVAVATHFPFLDRGLYFARMHPERSYVLAARPRGQVPQGMYLSTENPAHSIRSLPTTDGDLLMLGGESHKAGQGNSTERYRRLAAWAGKTFELQGVEYRWATQDPVTLDHVPFVGKLLPFSDRILVATGYRKWGFAAATAAARMLSDRVLGREDPWAFAFDPSRLRPRASAGSFAKENANVAYRFFADRVPKHSIQQQPAAGEGVVAGDGLGQRAICRDSSGRLHSLSARCTHLGCIVNWNGAEQSWDCPCHGSRFAADGTVIEGPAVDPLPPKPSG